MNLKVNWGQKKRNIWIKQETEGNWGSLKQEIGTYSGYIYIYILLKAEVLFKTGSDFYGGNEPCAKFVKFK